MPNFNCDGCAEAIQHKNPRIHCELCADYDLCANCFVVGRTTKTHAAYHPTKLFKVSVAPTVDAPQADLSLTGAAAANDNNIPPSGAQGTGLPAEKVDNTVGHGEAVPELPPSRHAVVQYDYIARHTTTISLQSGQLVIDIEIKDEYWWIGTNVQGETGFFPSSYAELDRSTNARPGWRPLLRGEDSQTPSSSFLYILYDLFSRLDVDRSGSLTLEELIAFFDNAKAPDGLLPGMEAARRGSGDDNLDSLVEADIRLAAFYDFIPASYTVDQRPGASKAARPLLDVKGFIQLHVFYAVYEPDMEHMMLNAALRTYMGATWRERGDIPRWAIPPTSSEKAAELQQRFLGLAHEKQANAKAQAQAQAEAEAEAAEKKRLEEQMQQMCQQFQIRLQINQQQQLQMQMQQQMSQQMIIAQTSLAQTMVDGAAASARLC